MIKQVDKNRLEITTTNGDTVTKLYIKIDSEKGQALILEHDLIIDPDMSEF